VRRLTVEPVRGILAAPAVTGPALNQLGSLGLEFREVSALPLEDDEDPRQPSLFAPA
jgi:RecB family endonuclease NucS